MICHDIPNGMSPRRTPADEATVAYCADQEDDVVMDLFSQREEAKRRNESDIKLTVKSRPHLVRSDADKR